MYLLVDAVRLLDTLDFDSLMSTCLLPFFNWTWRLHESFSRSNKKLSEFMVILCSRFQQQIFIVAKMVLEMIFVIKPLFYSSFVQVLHPAEIKGPTPRCQAWLIYILLQHPKHWFEWLCRFAREILDTLRGKLKTWIGKKNLESLENVVERLKVDKSPLSRDDWTSQFDY